ncbi:MAG: sulfite exporter TauE/SafE family protein [Bacteroidetes bacterium]|nr:sulfite exporter TauE/SafE family protein [Bacteroidota bacterium]
MNLLIISAIILGIANSFHCGAMCGPIISILNLKSNYKNASIWFYHAGRIYTYVLLGMLTGAIGFTIDLTGFSAYLSIISGVLFLITVLVHFNIFKIQFKSSKVLTYVKLKISNHLYKKTNLSKFITGMFNGLLPCGVLYMALAASLSAGTFAKSGVFMFFFGISTLPSLFFINEIKNALLKISGVKFQKHLPLIFISISFVLIIRGSGLGIPYVSPKSTKNNFNCHQIESKDLTCKANNKKK